MSTLVPTPACAQLLVYRFGAGSSFEGQLVGALERLESGGTLRVLDALFVTRDPATGEISAVDAPGKGIGSIVSPLLEFRLDPGRRRQATAHTQRHLGGDAAGLLPRLAETLEPGAALAAILIEHVWARTLEDAATRLSGSRVANDFVDARALHEVAGNLLAALDAA
jgi:hypothetical protein